MDEDSLKSLAADLGDCLLEQALVLATAESCTGGWVAKLITDRAGSSSYFDRGFVTYSNQAKKELLGVTEDALATHGAVSEQVAAQMAQGALANSHADMAVAVTGIAGPEGGSPEKPVGTVCFAWIFKGKEPRTETCQFQGNRESVRKASVEHLMREAIEALSSHQGQSSSA